jgi:mono/diheme cytochrome c family protein
MSRKIAIVVLWGAALLGASVCMRLVAGSEVTQAAAQKRTRRKTVSLTMSEAESLFNQRCAHCHGVNGRAYMEEGEVGVARTFTDKRWQAKVSDRRLINSITRGRGGMPSFRGTLSQKQIKALVAYVRQFGQDAPELGGRGERQ